MNNKRIAITGAFGFIGSNLTEHLLGQGRSVLAVGHNARGIGLKGAEILEGDLFELDLSRVHEWEPDVLVHLAGPAGVWGSWKDVNAEVRNSVLLTSRFIEFWRRKPDMRLVFVSSAAVYGDHPGEPSYSEDLSHDPQSPYGVCKSASEGLIRLVGDREGLDYIILRPFSVYGPGLRKQVVYDLALRFLGGEDPLEIKSTGKEERDFVHVRDCARVIASLCDIPKPADSGHCLNVGTGKPVTLHELAAQLAKESAYEGTYSFTGKDAPGNPIRLVADTKRLSSLGLSCDISLEAGIAELISAIREEAR